MLRPVPVASREPPLLEAWLALPRWEDEVQRDLGPRLADLLPRLWAIRRSGPPNAVESVLEPGWWADDLPEGPELDQARAVLGDLLLVAFSLGAAWADTLRESG